VTVKLGGVFPLVSDTVLYLINNPPLQKPIRGKIHYGPVDTAGAIRMDALNKFTSYFLTKMSDTLDTMKPSPPRLIQHNDEFDTIPETVHGPLFIDGSHFDLTWKTKKRIVVRGDLQITGKTALEGMDFLVTGEIKLFDDAHLRDVFLFSPKTITMSDRAVFSGTAMTLSTILVSGVASVENRSMLVVVRKPNAPVPKPPKPGDRGKKKLAVFSITFTESATVDATVVSLGDSLGIKIDRSAIVKGMLRSQGAMCFDGKVYGIIHASKFVDGPSAVSGKSTAAISVINGDLLPLEPREIRDYFFPFFMGKLSMIEWVEE
jgi:cytoskeletal protein CcmA (bactofilin family)